MFQGGGGISNINITNSGTSGIRMIANASGSATFTNVNVSSSGTVALDKESGCPLVITKNNCTGW